MEVTGRMRNKGKTMVGISMPSVEQKKKTGGD